MSSPTFSATTKRPALDFDMKITLSAILQVVAMLITMLLAWSSLSTRLTVLEQKITDYGEQQKSIDAKVSSIDEKVNTTNDNLQFIEGQASRNFNSLKGSK